MYTLDCDITTRGRSLASRIRLSVGVTESAVATERAPPNACASASGRSVEAGLGVGRVAFYFENKGCGEEESWTGPGGGDWRVRGMR
jgi:hypothetical protein